MGAATYQFSESTALSIRAGGSALQSIGILTLLFRLWFRLQIRRLWWEDAWAFVACVCAITALIAEWMYLKGDSTVAVVGFWGYSMALTCVVWAVRMSMLFSIARVTQPTECMRRIATAVAILFSLMFLVFAVVKVWWLSRNISWFNQTGYYTRPGRVLLKPLYIFQLCTDCISDLILASLAARMLWGIKLPRKQRRMIIAIFSSSLIVTGMSIFRGVSQILDMLSLIAVAADFEAACSTITCNLLVLVTLAYRCSRRMPSSHNPTPDSEDDDYTTSIGHRATTPTLTTIDLTGSICSEVTNQQDSCVAHLQC